MGWARSIYRTGSFRSAVILARRIFRSTSIPMASAARDFSVNFAPDPAWGYLSVRFDPREHFSGSFVFSGKAPPHLIDLGVEGDQECPEVGRSGTVFQHVVDNGVRVRGFSSESDGVHAPKLPRRAWTCTHSRSSSLASCQSLCVRRSPTASISSSSPRATLDRRGPGCRASRRSPPRPRCPRGPCPTPLR